MYRAAVVPTRTTAALLRCLLNQRAVVDRCHLLVNYRQLATAVLRHPAAGLHICLRSCSSSSNESRTAVGRGAGLDTFYYPKCFGSAFFVCGSRYLFHEKPDQS